MNKRQYTPTELGMMYGMTIGAVIGVILFAITNQPWWLGMIGIGVALGLGIGTAMDKRES